MEFNQVWATQNLVLLLIWDRSHSIVYFGTSPVRWGTGPSKMGPTMRNCVQLFIFGKTSSFKGNINSLTFSSPGPGTEGINANIIDDPLGQGYTCALCGKGFGVNKHHCRRHIKNFHKKNDIALSCDVCQKSYKNYDSLQHHQRASHGLYKQ